MWDEFLSTSPSGRGKKDIPPMVTREIRVVIGGMFCKERQGIFLFFHLFETLTESLEALKGSYGGAGDRKGVEPR